MKVSGIVPARDVLNLGLPLDLAIKTWSHCCDEIVVVTITGDGMIPVLMELVKEVSCDLKIRAIEGPFHFDGFRFFGYYWTSKPDWVIHFDADYLISPDEAKKLRQFLEDCDQETECVTYVLNYLNYFANRRFYTEDLKTWIHPNDGFRAEHPFVVNPRTQTFICPFMGSRERGHYINYEGVMSLSQEHWGKGYMTKFDKDKSDLRMFRSEVNVEHLLWSMNPPQVKHKVERNPYKEWGVQLNDVLGGQSPYEVAYPVLEEARRRYK